MIRTPLALYAAHRRQRQPAVLAAVQAQKLSRLLQHARAQVPHYQRALSTLPLDRMEPGEALAQLPLLSRQHLQQQPPEQLIARDAAAFRTGTTSGSTGVPLRFHRSRRDRAAAAIPTLRTLTVHGYRPLQRQYYLVAPRRGPPPLPVVGYLRRQWVSAGTALEEQVHRYLAAPPRHVHAYTSALLSLAEFILATKRTVPAPQLITLSAEILTPAARETIARAFGVVPINCYNASELGHLAWECEHRSGLHLNTDHFVFEVVDAAGRPLPVGERGELVVTALDLYTMPLIRYRLGDVVRLSRRACPCGRALPLLETLEGRCDDLLHLPDGRRISHIGFGRIAADLSSIRRFQIVQHSLQDVAVRIVPGPAFGPTVAAEIRAHFQEIFGPTVQLRLEPVEQIPLRAGKLRCVISHVGRSSTGADAEVEIRPGEQQQHRSADEEL